MLGAEEGGREELERRQKERVSITAIKYSDKHRLTGNTYRQKFSMLS